MNPSPSFFSTGSYLNAEWRDSRSPWPGRLATTDPFITISREAGSGGASLARLLARKLNAESSHDVTWRVFEDNLTPTMLKTHRLPRELARFLPEARVPEIQTIFGEMLGLHPSLWELVQKTNETMRELARRGNVILVGRGACFATAGMARGLHLRLVAPARHRAHYLTQRYGISEAEAMACNARCDRARRGYAKAYFNADDRKPSAYDLLINTARIPLPDAAQLVASRIATLCSASPVG